LPRTSMKPRFSVLVSLQYSRNKRQFGHGVTSKIGDLSHLNLTAYNKIERNVTPQELADEAMQTSRADNAPRNQIALGRIEQYNQFGDDSMLNHCSNPPS
jgi:hypothetical protein